jgi:hypothetical protein
MNKLLSVAAIGCALALAACERGMPVEAREKEMLLLAADLVPFGYDLPETQKYDTFSKTRYFDGTFDIVYEHESPDSEPDHVLYMNVTVTFERNAADAMIGRGAETTALKYTLKAGGIEIREIPKFFPYRDASDFHVLERDGKPVGNYFSVRDGARLYSVVMTGIYFDDADEWKELIGEKLVKFSTYSAKGPR